MDLSKVETGSFDLSSELLSSAELIQDAIEVSADFARTKSAILEVDAGGDSVHIKGDRRRLVQVLTNLISNGVKFSPPSGTVRIVAMADAGVVRFSVIDSGAGIPPDVGEKIFEKFFQVDGSDSRNAEGTGLGLAISKAIVEHHGGKIWYESEPGQGTQFHFELPRTDAL